MNDRQPMCINPVNPRGVLAAHRRVKRLSRAKLTLLDVFLEIFQGQARAHGAFWWLLQNIFACRQAEVRF